jgi:hypothetical protein
MAAIQDGYTTPLRTGGWGGYRPGGGRPKGSVSKDSAERAALREVRAALRAASAAEREALAAEREADMAADREAARVAAEAQRDASASAARAAHASVASLRAAKDAAKAAKAALKSAQTAIDALRAKPVIIADFQRAYYDVIDAQRDRIVDALVSRAIAGDSRLLADLAMRLLGRPSLAVELSGSVAVPLFFLGPDSERPAIDRDDGLEDGTHPCLQPHQALAAAPEPVIDAVVEVAVDAAESDDAGDDDDEPETAT